MSSLPSIAYQKGDMVVNMSYRANREQSLKCLENLPENVRERFCELWGAYDYTEAENLLGRHLFDEKGLELAQVCRGFACWDRFEHGKAYPLLRTNSLPLQDYLHFLEAILASRNFLEGKKPTSARYELVEDLVLNADRRATRRYFDDAVGRLYRAVELLVQIYLLAQYGQRSGDLDIERLPVEARTIPLRNAQGNYCTALIRSYELLAFFPGDSLWPIYQAHKDQLLQALEVRNQSLFAHGLSPILEDDYRMVRTTLGGFIEKALASFQPSSCLAIQLPSSLTSFG